MLHELVKLAETIRDALEPHGACSTASCAMSGTPYIYCVCRLHVLLIADAGAREREPSNCAGTVASRPGACGWRTSLILMWALPRGRLVGCCISSSTGASRSPSHVFHSLQFCHGWLQAVEDGSLQIVPARFIKTWSMWLENIRDWCISRQLWWGHRIPVWYAFADEAAADAAPGGRGDDYVVARNEQEALQQAQQR